MRSPITIVGNAPEQDVALLGEIAGKFGVTVVEYPQIEGLAAFAADRKPMGYISYLSSINLAMQEIVGVAQQDQNLFAPLPLFQRVDGAEVPSPAAGLPIAGLFVSPLVTATAWTMVHTIVQAAQTAARTNQLVGEIKEYRQQKNMLVEIGTALSRENDLERLLQVILSVCRDTTLADAGNIYIRERSAPGESFLNDLRCKGAQNDTVTVGRVRQFKVPIDRNSIAGYVAGTGKPLNIPEMSVIDASAPYRAAKEFQVTPGYRVKSMLSLPLKNKDGDVVAVLQLMNKKKEHAAAIDSDEACADRVVPFTMTDMEFLGSVAAQAAVSIERAQLYDNIRELFEGFLRSSIAAIDERDRTTSGHSKRVMGYAMAFAEAAGTDPGSPFAELTATPERKRQLEFAALLHDIGKIGVPERILTKEGRLQQDEFALVLARLDYIAFALKYAPQGVSWKSTKELADDRKFLERINVAARLRDDDLQRLATLKEKFYHTADGRKTRFLNDHELESLSVRSGNLTREEREAINSHAISTYRILSKIPWTRQFEMIPVIAATHHERIDGSGYPHGLRGEEMSCESKILAVIDVYEALVSQDRPYKPKLPPEKALEILNREVAAKHLDADVVKLFIEKGIYKLYTDQKKT
jgi:HD-GYP domain-containing protein (c-di-GMP phosphodiesterase class II)